MSVPKGWMTRTLGSLGLIQGGGTPSRNEPSYFGGSIPWVTPTDLSPKGRVASLGNVAEAISDAGLRASSAKMLERGSVLFSSRASIGKIAVSDRPCATNQGFINITPIADVADAWFVAYLLAWRTPELVRLAGKTTFLEIPKGKFKDFEIQLPGVLEQRRIASCIRDCMERADEIQALREAARKQQVHLSAAVIESVLHPSLATDAGWAKLPVNDIIVESRNGRSISQDVEGRANGFVLTLTAVRRVGLSYEYKKAIELPEQVESQFRIQPGDVFVSRANTLELVGLSSVAEARSEERLIFPDLLIKLRVDPSRVLPRYLAYALRSAGARRQIKARALGASQTMVKISGERLREVVVPVPSLTEQEAMVAHLDAAHELIERLSEDSSAIDVDAVRVAILRKAFEGEL